MTQKANISTFHELFIVAVLIVEILIWQATILFVTQHAKSLIPVKVYFLSLYIPAFVIALLLL